MEICIKCANDILALLQRSTSRHDYNKYSSIVLWRKPFTTLNYFVRELSIEAHEFVQRWLKFYLHCMNLSVFFCMCSVLNHKKSVSAVVLLTIVFFLSYYLDGPHQKVNYTQKMRTHACIHVHTHTHTHAHTELYYCCILM